MREQVWIHTPQYYAKLEQHAEFVELKGVRVTVTPKQFQESVEWDQRIKAKNANTVQYKPYQTCRPYNGPKGSNVTGDVAAKAVHRLVGGQFIANDEGVADPGWDIELGFRKLDVKWRQWFLTPDRLATDETATDFVPDIKPGVELVLVNPIEDSLDVVVCGVINRETFVQWMFDFYYPQPSLAVTAQPLRHILSL